MWLIVGGGGQLGHCMATFLEKKSIDFVSLDRSSLDISNSQQVSDVVHDLQPSIVLNAAAWTAVDEAEDQETEAMAVNAIGPKNLAKAAVYIHAQLIHISTDYVFNGSSKEPYRVDSPTQPSNAYGRTKLAGENAVLEIGKGSFPIIRTAWLYSEFGKNFAKTICSRALHGDPARVVDDQLGQPTSAHDLAAFIFQIAHLEISPSIIHGTNGGQATWYEFAKEIYSLLDVDTSLVKPVESAAFPTKARRPSYSVLDHSDLKNRGINSMQDWRLGLAGVLEKIKRSIEMES